MSQLLCKLESGGLVIVLSQTKAVSKQEWSSFQLVVSWAYRLRGPREAGTALSPGWSASRLGPGAPLCSLSSFLFQLWLCACAAVYVPMCGPSGCCQADQGSCCELALLSVYLQTSAPKRRVKERRDTGWEEGGYNWELEWVHSSTCTKHVCRGTANLARFTDSPPLPLTFLVFFLPLSFALEWFKQRDNLERNSIREEIQELSKKENYKWNV